MKHNPNVEAWIVKAEADFDDAIAAAKRRKRGAGDIACFHAQQCVEKYLKAVLIRYRLGFPKTHDLSKLVDWARHADPLLAVVREEAAALTRYAVDARYPGDEATPAEARAAVKTMKKIRLFLRKKLGLRR